jgi:hypothetical protein
MFDFCTSNFHFLVNLQALVTSKKPNKKISTGFMSWQA